MPAAVNGGGTGDGADTGSPADLHKKLDASRKELASILSKKRSTDRNLTRLEASIYAFETSYLGTTEHQTNLPNFGNIVKGYDAYVKAVNSSNHAGSSDRKKNLKSGSSGAHDIKDEDRLFSRSSATFDRALELREREGTPQASSENDEDHHAAANTSSRKKRRV